MEAKQWQELCEWVPVPTVREEYLGEGHNREIPIPLPPQDMNTLFKWMVPKLENLVIIKIRLKSVNVITRIKSNSEVMHIYEDRDPFEALAQAIYKVVEGEQ